MSDKELITRGREFARSSSLGGGKQLVSALCDALEASATPGPQPEPSSEVQEPSAEEFRARIADERARQVDLGYDILHDRHHGVDHLLGWAQDYARRGRTVQAAALIEAARELYAKSAEPQGEPSDSADSSGV